MFQLSPSDRESLTSFLRDLVRTPSPTGQEGAVAERLAAEMRAVGLADVHLDKAGSVVGRLGTGQGPVLVYNGHMDNVGAGNRSDWRHDPFGAVVEEGVLYGRGACDMKGALAAMVHGTKLLIQAQTPLSGTLYVVGVVQEETCEGLAMRLLMETESLKPDFVLLGEPSNLQVSRGHKGRMAIRLTARGRAAHGSAPERGENAIYKMARLALGVEQLNSRLPADPLLGKGSITLNVIAGGNELNVIADACTAYLDRRLTLGEDEAGAVREIALLAAREGIQAEVEVMDYNAQSYNGYPLRARRVFNAWSIAEDHPLVQATVVAAESALGHKPAITHWAFSTDGAYTAGVAGIPTVGFGPGEEHFAHTVDEQIRLADVFAAAQVYAELAQRLLG
jgi:putative selenium metabolism hydrolase